MTNILKTPVIALIGTLHAPGQQYFPL